MLIIAQISPESNPREKMTPLDDHELLLWSMRAGLTRAEVRQTVRYGRGAGDLTWPGARIAFMWIWRLSRLRREWRVSPLELLEWPLVLVEGFQACGILGLRLFHRNAVELFSLSRYSSGLDLQFSPYQNGSDPDALPALAMSYLSVAF